MHKLQLHLRRQLSVLDGFWMLLLTFILMNGLVASGIVPVERLAGFLPGGATVINCLLVQQLLQVLIMVGLVFWFLHLRGVSVRRVGLRPFAQRRWIVLSIFCGVVTFFVMLLLTTWMTQLFPQWAKPQTVTELIMQARTGWEWLAAILIVSVLAPFSEELLFRGYMYHSLRQYKGVTFSIVITSLMFGCMHYDLFRLLPLTLVGCCLNLVSVRSGSLWGSILMHGTWNFMMTLVMMAL